MSKKLNWGNLKFPHIYIKNILAMSCTVSVLSYGTTTAILKKAISHHINIAKLVLGGWQSDQKMHPDKIPGALWYRQEHVEACFMLVNFVMACAQKNLIFNIGARIWQ